MVNLMMSFLRFLHIGFLVLRCCGSVSRDELPQGRGSYYWSTGGGIAPVEVELLRDDENSDGSSSDVLSTHSAQLANAIHRAVFRRPALRVAVDEKFHQGHSYRFFPEDYAADDHHRVKRHEDGRRGDEDHVDADRFGLREEWYLRHPEENPFRRMLGSPSENRRSTGGNAQRAGPPKIVFWFLGLADEASRQLLENYLQFFPELSFRVYDDGVRRVDDTLARFFEKLSTETFPHVDVTLVAEDEEVACVIIIAHRRCAS